MRKTTTIDLDRSRRLGVVYEASVEGHRGPNQDLLATTLKLRSVSGALNFLMWRELVGAPQLLISTFDDNLAGHSLVVLCRGLLGRPTVGLVLRPQSCLDTVAPKQQLKKLIFAAVRMVRGVTLFAFTPFSVEPRYASVVHVGAHDPQYWDLHNGQQIRTPLPTALSDEIVRLAGDRKVLCSPGLLSSIKGFSFLSSIVHQDPTVCQSVLIVAAGKVPDESKAAAKTFVAAGGVLVDRRLTDAELESLYAVSDGIWSCYAPEYDQASGIFGRAVQLGVPAIVRQGSVIDRFASGLSSPVVALKYGDASAGALRLKQSLPDRLSGIAMAEHTDLVASWREEFLRGVRVALRL